MLAHSFRDSILCYVIFELFKKIAFWIVTDFRYRSFTKRINCYQYGFLFSASLPLSNFFARRI